MNFIKPAAGRVPPHSVEAEEQLLSVCLLDGGEALARAEESGVEPASFYVPANRIIYERLLAMVTTGKPIELAVLAEELKAARQLDGVGGYAYLTRVADRVATTAGLSFFIKKVRELALLRSLITTANGAVENCYNYTGPEDLDKILAPLREAGTQAGADDTLARLDAARITPAGKPPQAIPTHTLANIPVATAGNLTAIVAQAKSGKTAFCGAVLAASILAETGEAGDTLGVSASVRPADSVVVVVDTEQSPADAWTGLERVARRAGVSSVPDWIRLYALSGESPAALRAALRAELRRLRRVRKTVWFVIIDGVADLCADPNDIRESQEVVTEVHAHAKEATCPVFCVIHRNEGEQANSSARGHLGKQLARKAAYNLRLERDDEVTTVFATQNRGAPISKKDGPRFRWSDAAAMHLSVATAGRESEDRKITVIRDLLDDVLPVGKPAVSYVELRDGIIKVRGCSDRTAERNIQAAIASGLLRKAGGGTYARA